jgi:hypothetical protein
MAPKPFITGYQGFMGGGRVVIAKDAQISEAINLGGFVLAGITFPALFTGTALTFLVGDSLDGFQAVGEVTFSGTCTDGDTLTIKGVAITFKDIVTLPSSQVLIGGTAAETAANLQTFLAASINADLLLMTYETVDTVLTITAKAYGVAGNSYTLAKSSTDLSISGATLAGGGFRPLYSAANSLVSMTVAQGRCYAVDPVNFQGVQFLQIKSGSAETSARTIICALKGF